MAGEGEHALLESFLSPISLAWAPSGHQTKCKLVQKTLQGLPSLLSLSDSRLQHPFCTGFPPLWQEAEQLGVSPLPSMSVTPALGCGLELPAAAPRCCMALFLLLPYCTHPSLAASAHSWCSQVMATKLSALKP